MRVSDTKRLIYVRKRFARTRFAIFLTGIIALGLACNNPNGTKAEDDVPQIEEEVDSYLAPYVTSQNFSGSILLARGNDVLLEKGFGLANREHAVPITADTKFQIASISKSFTAAAILLLQEDGKLRLDDQIVDFIPGFPHGQEITVRHLLEHTSGLARYVFQPDYSDRSQRPQSTQDLVDWIKDKPLTSAPGERYNYSNANYALLAHIIEKVSGVSYGTFLQHQIFAPLTLSQTGHREQAGEIVTNLASGYTPVGLESLQISRYFDYSTNTGSGSIYSTPGDLLSWFSARNKGLLLDQATRDEMQEELGTPLGFGWNLENRLEREALVMRGWDGVGFACRLVHYFQDEITVIVLSNLNMSSTVDDIADNLANIAFGRDYQPFQILAEPIESVAELKELEGQYRFGSDFFVPGASMTIVESNGQLIMPGETPQTLGGLMPVAANSFIHRQQGFHVSFERNDEGIVSGMKYGQFRAEKIVD